MWTVIKLGTKVYLENLCLILTVGSKCIWPFDSDVHYVCATDSAKPNTNKGLKWGILICEHA